MEYSLSYIDLLFVVPDSIEQVRLKIIAMSIKQKHTIHMLPVMFCAGVIQLLLITLVMAAPAASELLKACEHSLANGFEGIEGDMCTWYVTPCDCDYGMASDTPRVCLPKSEPVESLAQTVVEGLREQPELHAEDADFAAATILSRIYPCNE